MPFWKNLYQGFIFHNKATFSDPYRSCLSAYVCTIWHSYHVYKNPSWNETLGCLACFAGLSLSCSVPLVTSINPLLMYNNVGIIREISVLNGEVSLGFFRKTCPLKHHSPTIQVFFETDLPGFALEVSCEWSRAWDPKLIERCVIGDNSLFICRISRWWVHKIGGGLWRCCGRNTHVLLQHMAASWCSKT